jgi:hypothetical protein
MYMYVRVYSTYLLLCTVEATCIHTYTNTVIRTCMDIIYSPNAVQVFQPKQYLSSRDAHCVRCSIKASDGLLNPLAKSFIFINKPTVIIAYEDIEFIEFKRYEPVANSASRSFSTQEAHS